MRKEISGARLQGHDSVKREVNRRFHTHEPCLRLQIQLLTRLKMETACASLRIHAFNAQLCSQPSGACAPPTGAQPSCGLRARWRLQPRRAKIIRQNPVIGCRQKDYNKKKRQRQTSLTGSFLRGCCGSRDFSVWIPASEKKTVAMKKKIAHLCLNMKKLYSNDPNILFSQ